MIWTGEKLVELSLVDLKNLLENAKERGNNQVVALCEAELIARMELPQFTGHSDPLEPGHRLQ